MIPASLPVDIYKHINDFLFGYDARRHTPTYMAKTNNLKGIQWIVQHKKWNEEDLNRALRWAAEKGHLDMIKYLVSQGADVTACNNMAIRWAARKGQLEVVQYLVSQGADVTALHHSAARRAAANGHPKVVQYLVSRGAILHH
jgi:hypothetical protein